MEYANGDIWTLASQEGGWVVVTTNTTLKEDGTAVMGAGIALSAKTRFPELPKLLGEHIRCLNDNLYIYKPIICLPTKTYWRHNASIELIEKGCHALVELDSVLNSVNSVERIFLPQLGCGLGGLNWERQVRPLIDSILESERFILVNY